MTLRARLATAFFAVLLGPAVSGAYLAWTYWPQSMTTPSTDALIERLVAECAHLSATAQGYAASGVTHTSDLAGPWLICGPDAAEPVRTPVLVSTGMSYQALAARVEVRDADGLVTGYAYAVQPLDADFLSQLSVAAGGRVSLVPAGQSGAVQGLPFGLTPTAPPSTRDGWLVAVIASSVLAAAMFGWWLAGLATRPLKVLLRAVERVADGDLEARSQLVGRDETGRLGTGLDRLISRLQETLQLSVTDPLTGLGNVRQLGDALRREAERATRFGRTFGVLMLDLDHFKDVNDRYGHRAGDTVLVEFARRIRRAIREVDLSFRQGGEEFVILLPETDVAGSLTAARRIGEAIRETPFPLPRPATASSPGLSSGSAPDPLPDTEVTVTVSIGVAVFPRHSRTAGGILDAADVALYAAKRAGRDTFALAEGPIETATPLRRVPVAVPPRATRVRLAEAGGASGGTPSPRTSQAG
jgi:diguanylate cyclase (GGDEF)-like protein